MAAAQNTVPQPTFGPLGFIAPSEKDAVLPAVKNDIDVILGGDVNMDDTTPQGQIAVSMAAAVGNKNDLFVKYTQQVDPAFADGRMQDAIARIYFISRMGAEPTAVACTCSGLVGLVIPAGSQAADVSGNLYASLADGTIDAGGTATIQFAALVPGPTPCPAGTLTTIYQAVNGWDSITNPADGVLGRNTETRAEFEDRRRLSVAQNARGSLPAILGAVLNVDGILDAFVTENATSGVVSINGVAVAPYSIYVSAVGGSDADVAQAIWSRKAPGCAYNGNTTVVVVDQNPAYVPPYPSYSVSFERPAATSLLFAVSIKNNALVPANAAALIQAAIIAAIAGADGGPRQRIGSLAFASRYYPPVAALGSWAEIVSIKVGCVNNASAKFVAAIAGTALTVSSVTSGTIAIGQTLLGAGILPGTTILSGSGTSWVVSATQTVLSEAMSGCLANLDDVQFRIDQAPAAAAGDIVVTLV